MLALQATYAWENDCRNRCKHGISDMFTDMKIELSTIQANVIIMSSSECQKSADFHATIGRFVVPSVVELSDFFRGHLPKIRYIKNSASLICVKRCLVLERPAESLWTSPERPCG